MDGAGVKINLQLAAQWYRNAEEQGIRLGKKQAKIVTAYDNSDGSETMLEKLRKLKSKSKPRRSRSSPTVPSGDVSAPVSPQPDHLLADVAADREGSLQGGTTGTDTRKTESARLLQQLLKVPSRAGLQKQDSSKACESASSKRTPRRKRSRLLQLR